VAAVVLNSTSRSLPVPPIGNTGIASRFAARA
jgi:hypothetical protein